MKSENKFKLIEGVFNPDDAKEVIINLLQNKLQFHSNKLFSSEIKFGIKDEYSKERLKQLNQSKTELLEILKECELNNYSLKINSSIEIEIIK